MAVSFVEQRPRVIAGSMPIKGGGEEAGAEPKPARLIKEGGEAARRSRRPRAVSPCSGRAPPQDRHPKDARIRWGCLNEGHAFVGPALARTDFGQRGA